MRFANADAEVVPLQGGSLKEVTKRFKGIRAFVAGASGGTGRAIVERLVAEGVPVRALVRDLDKAVRMLLAYYLIYNLYDGIVS